MKSRSTQRALCIFVATAVVTPVLGVAAAGAAKTSTTANSVVPAPTTATTLSPSQIEERCANGATDTRTSKQVQDFMATDPHSMYMVGKMSGASAYYRNGYFGQGVDIALIDSGVAKVPGLDKGSMLNGVDLSWESQAVHATPANNDLWRSDTYGHGTHLAGIMTGRDVKEVTKNNWDDRSKFTGVAPMARTLSMKVADAGGATDITQVIAAIDWVVKHAHDPGLNVRVINLSYGLNSYTSSSQDALSYAVQQAWDAGIVVVAAAGNEGKAGTKDENGIAQDLGLTSPAFNRDVIAVASYGYNGASDFSTGSSSENMRLPDFAAWGESIPSLHVLGSTTDDMIVEQCKAALAKGESWSTPIIGADGRFVKGSGTSQAAAVASAAVALMLSKEPRLSPDQIKRILAQTAAPVDGTSRRQVGEGAMDLGSAYYKTAKDQNPGNTNLQWTSLDMARGDSILESPVKKVEVVPGACTDPKFIPDRTAFCASSKLSGNVDWLGNPINPGQLMANEAVSSKKSPYCLEVSDYVTQKAFMNGKCNSPYTQWSPKAWTTDIQGGFVVERWNSGPGVMYTGSRFIFSEAPTNVSPPPAMWPVKWPAPSWLGMAWSDMDWSDIAWGNDKDLSTNRWKVSRLKDNDFSTSRLRGHDFSVSRLKGSNLTVSRLRGSTFTSNRWKDYGWKEFGWS